MEKRVNHLLQQFESGQLSQDERQELLVLADAQPDLVTAEIMQMIAEEEQNTNDYFEGKDIREIISSVKNVNNLETSNLKIGDKLQIPTL